MLEGTRAARFELVTAAHHFVLAALPLRHPRTRQALAVFIQTAASISLSSPDREAVLLKTLGVLNPHTGKRLPSLVDRYLSLAYSVPDALSRFEYCVGDVIRYSGIGNPHVQRAIQVIHDRYGDSTLHESDVASAVDLTPSALSKAFATQTGLTFGEYLRNVRLDHAAAMLAQSLKSIKEVWGSLGYNAAANFDHHFRDRFGMTPTEYRARAIWFSPTDSAHVPAKPVLGASTQPGANSRRVLIVDDDQGTRETVGTRLRLDGYVVGAAATGREALDSAARDRWNIVVLDFHLPDMTGLDCLRTLRQRQPGLHPAVVLFTADWEAEDHVDEAHALGATIESKLCDFGEFERFLAALCAR